MSKPKPVQTDDFRPREKATKLIRELAVQPPVKGMANVKAATDAFEANLPHAAPLEAGQADEPVERPRPVGPDRKG